MTSNESLRATVSEYDVVIPVISKDFSKLPTCVSKIKRNLSADNIYVVSPSIIQNEAILEAVGAGVTYLLDEDVIDEYTKIFKGVADKRTKWPGLVFMYQQFFIKAFQDFTANKWYVTMDADLFVMRNIYANREDPTLFLTPGNGAKEIPRYRKFQEAVLGAANYPYSVMNEITLYNKDVWAEFIEHMGGMTSFIDKSLSVLTRSCSPAEAQLYFAWVQIAYPSLYSVDSLKYCWKGMYNAYNFSEAEISRTLANHAGDCDIYLLHSWDATPPGVSGAYNA
jgi:hypothetical protein